MTRRQDFLSSYDSDIIELAIQRAIAASAGAALSNTLVMLDGDLSVTGMKMEGLGFPSGWDSSDIGKYFQLGDSNGNIILVAGIAADFDGGTWV